MFDFPTSDNDAPGPITPSISQWPSLPNNSFSVVKGEESVTMASEVSAQQRRKSSVAFGSDFKRNSVIIQRLAMARQRTDAALTIQRAWHRYYVSDGRKARHDAARKIQFAWGSKFLVESARRELLFLRWLRHRRQGLRTKWWHVVKKLQLREQWAMITITRFKDVCIRRKRLQEIRRNRCARILQRWWRFVTHHRQTYHRVLEAMENAEFRRSEHVSRRNLVKQQLTTFRIVAANVQHEIEELNAAATRAFIARHTPRAKKHSEKSKVAPIASPPLISPANCDAPVKQAFKKVAALAEPCEPMASVPQRPSVSNVHPPRPTSRQGSAGSVPADVHAPSADEAGSHDGPSPRLAFTIKVRPPSALVAARRRRMNE